jgi:metal-responsive CopG/Arc/MetJ family transcriptional regulator
MGYWSIYVTKEDEKLLKKKLDEIAAKKRWSFSQAISETLREHLIEEKNRRSDEETWNSLASNSFLEGYSEKDSIYDTL